MTTALATLQKFYYGLLGIGGGLLSNSTAITGTYTCDLGAVPDYIVLTNFTSSGATVTLPASTSGRTIKVKDIAGTANTRNITITPPSGTIDGASTYVLNLAHASVELTCDGTNWWVTGSYTGTVV